MSLAEAPTVADDGQDHVPLDVVLKESEVAIRRYCILSSEHAYVAVVLWAAATYGQKIWDNAPRLAIVSPEKRCGKSRLMEVVGYLSYKPDEFVNSTPAAIFRSISKVDPPTLLIDEADTIFSDKKGSSESNAELRGLLNSGHRRGGAVKRCIDFGKKVVSFPTFAMVALCSIRDLPDTIMDRSVVIRMRRRRSTEHVEPFRIARDKPGLIAIAQKLSLWALDMEVPETVPNPLEDRAADTWEPLMAIAYMAGGDWPERAEAAALALVGAESGRPVQSLSLDLLTDIRAVWPKDRDRVFTIELIQGLTAGLEDNGTNWADFRGRGPITSRDIAFHLKDYDVTPTTVKANKKAAKGYKIEDMAEAWSRYLSPEVTEDGG
jgi:hypothetical protein